jgi:hypothetical protein
MVADRVQKDTWRAEGYMGDLFKGLEYRTNDAGEKEYPVAFWAYKPRIIVHMGEATLVAAGIKPENGRIVVADIKKGATAPEEVNPVNLEDGGILPGLDEEYTWLQPK